MDARFPLLLKILALCAVFVAIALLLRSQPITATTPSSASVANTETASAVAPAAAENQPAASSTAATSTKAARKTKAPVASISSPKPPAKAIATTITPATATTSTQNNPNQAVRIENPYSSPPESSDRVNTDTRLALVNILCLSRGSIQPISGSGVIIDVHGVILTNAHVAQYILLSENPAVDLSCTIRTGSPAQAAWTARVLYMPPAWVAAHVSEFNTQHPTGTGEHDYALLLIDGSASGAPLPDTFPALPVDVREAIGFTGDQALVAGYPAEFLGGIQAEQNLFANTSITAIGQLLTFGSGSVDVISLGGIIEAQSGSSGGAVVNPWGRLIGIITTTSEGATTAQRDLHALTLAYIDRDIEAQTGHDLATILAGNLADEENDFNARILPSLLDKYMARIKPAQQ